MAYFNFTCRASEIEDAIGSCKLYMKDLQDAGFFPEVIPRLEGAILALELLQKLEHLNTMGSTIVSQLTWRDGE